jgi:hypothetical protein
MEYANRFKTVIEKKNFHNWHKNMLSEFIQFNYFEKSEIKINKYSPRYFFNVVVMN